MKYWRNPESYWNLGFNPTIHIYSDMQKLSLIAEDHSYTFKTTEQWIQCAHATRLYNIHPDALFGTNL